MNPTDLIRWRILIPVILATTDILFLNTVENASASLPPASTLTLRVNRELIPGWYDVPYVAEAKAAVYAAFRQQFPHIQAVNSRGLSLPGARTWEN